MDDFVHEYFSVERLRKAYVGTFIPMTSKDPWPRVDLGYKIHKPKLRRKPRRPRKSRFKAYDEVNSNKKRRLCSECHEPGHLAKTCQGGLTMLVKREGSILHNMDHKRTTTTQSKSWCTSIYFWIYSHCKFRDHVSSLFSASATVRGRMKR